MRAFAHGPISSAVIRCVTIRQTETRQSVVSTTSHTPDVWARRGAPEPRQTDSRARDENAQDRTGSGIDVDRRPDPGSRMQVHRNGCAGTNLSWAAWRVQTAGVAARPRQSWVSCLTHSPERHSAVHTCSLHSQKFTTPNLACCDAIQAVTC